VRVQTAGCIIIFRARKFLLGINLGIGILLGIILGNSALRSAIGILLGIKLGNRHIYQVTCVQTVLVPGTRHD
jgi:hypothetical protein